MGIVKRVLVLGAGLYAAAQCLYFSFVVWALSAGGCCSSPNIWTDAGIPWDERVARFLLIAVPAVLGLFVGGFAVWYGLLRGGSPAARRITLDEYRGRTRGRK